MVHAIDRRLGLGLGFHLDETETARLTAELIFKDADLVDLAVGTERLSQIFLSDIARQVTDKNIH
ncbi:MAG: hypothetical protein A2151_05140 [Candidatus Muproteobacteria bacterium RBG_16_65_34]|uniref:Uncharacterized protein n=1 Tax=Candidatus Muproteobacteria bacterium RBG_16_65_34 TaxID=1817760 RepID=A0A1F6TSF4_9PROT|nr:MAG: hypothetical protein A2151_05140 [Candidatus Muproteobacteria bacterium RBG_16_65_34]